MLMIFTKNSLFNPIPNSRNFITKYLILWRQGWGGWVWESLGNKTLHLKSFLFLLFWLCSVARGILFPDQGLTPCPLHWKHGVLTTGPPGKFLKSLVFEKKKKQNHNIVIQYWLSGERKRGPKNR